MSIRTLGMLLVLAVALNLASHWLVLYGSVDAFLDFVFGELQLSTPFGVIDRRFLLWDLIRLGLDMMAGLLSIALIWRYRRDQRILSRGLAGSQSRMRSVFEAAVDAIVMIDSKGRIEAVNPATERLFGYQAEEMVGQNVKMLMPDPYHSEHDQYLKNYARTGQKKMIGVGREAACRRKDGSTFSAYLSVSEVKHEGHRYYTGILHDISELKEAEHKLALERNFISAVLETAGAAVVVLDRHGRIVNFNRASQEISGYTHEEAYGRLFWELLLPEAHIVSTRKAFDALLMGQFPNYHENPWRTKSGRERWIQWSNTALEADANDGRVDFVVAIGIDVTEKRRSERELSMLSRKIIEIQEDERNRIAGEIHDVLGQSLIALKFMIDDVAYRSVSEARPPVELGDQFKAINDYVDQTAGQAREISHNLSPIALKQIGLSHALRELVHSVQANSEHSFELQFDQLDEFFEERWEINVYRIVQESLTNILKHADAKHIAITAGVEDDRLVLRIKDDGVGFDPQAARGATRGLGQLIMQERAHLLGARLSISSEPGAGTEMTLEIPRR